MINEEVENQINLYHKEMQKAVSHVEIALDLWEDAIEDGDLRKTYQETASYIRRGMERICRLCRPEVRRYVENNIRSLLCRNRQIEEWQRRTEKLCATRS